MYLLPFFSYRQVDDTVVLTNHITKKQAVDTWATVEALEAIYNSPTDPVRLPAIAEEMELVFADRDEANRWLDTGPSRQTGRLPKIEQIELTNRCPYTCKMCPRTFEMDRGLGDMSLELFDSIMRQVSGDTKFCALHHFGESLLHKGIGEAIAIALGHGVRTGLSCNPPSLLPKRAEAVLTAGIANMVLSLDSLDPEVYKSIRGRAARFDIADRNLRELVRLRNEGGHDTNLTLQMINMHANTDEAEQFLAYCEELGVDRGVVIRLERWDFDDELVAELGEHTSAGYTEPCTRPWNSVAILWDGRVVPCCHDYNGEKVLGDLRHETLEEIWAKPESREFRSRNAEMAICGKCAFGQSFREARRQKEGFHRFHREVTEPSGARWEWFNPSLLDAGRTRAWYDGFDVLPAVPHETGA
ncbi:radical SAM protein [Streptomyces sp. MP131-18]|uniref:radical SAM/SPASM domain-containing protein n=1 Tax=Streptomyces sp. MP131-18 TaxID=1857892 RepID=UPI00097BACAA|nr:radical SAM protein [Streptomyces sp. MP131-18]ONK10479.1 pyrroloquinoline quinone biosynthesis protein PqqE [Streptomyces sp. MP131-18]